MTELGKIESLFFKILEDLTNYLDNLTLVGGWMPYVYSKFLWNNLVVQPVTTVDIDFGFGNITTKVYPKTIFEILSKLDYTERHPQMDRLYPVVLCKEGKIPIDFITSPEINAKTIERFMGKQMSVNKIENFDFLLEHKIPIDVNNGINKAIHRIYCPSPSAFLYHKAATFIDREDE